MKNHEIHEDLFGDSLPYLFSCHECEGERIPFVHKTIDSIMKPYDSATNLPSEGEGDYLTVCRNPNDKLEFGL